MNKEEVLKQYKTEEDKLLVAKILDKWEQAKTKNKITNTDFLNEYERKKAQKLMEQLKIGNRKYYGAYEEAQRQIILFYADKFNEDMMIKNQNNIVKIVQIILPKQLQGEYSHRDYLGALMKIGIKREKIGDILAFQEGAQILILKEMAQYVKETLQQLTRFSKAEIQIKEIQELRKPEIQTQKIEIMVSSLRMDNIVAALAKTSRKKAEEMILQARIFVNAEEISKVSKLVKESDTITIRGKGKFKLQGIVGNTKKGRYVVCVEQYV